MSTPAAWYLYPRICPVLALSRDDIKRSVESYGESETLSVIASLISSQYEFPYLRHSNSGIGTQPPKVECTTVPAPSTMLLGGYRCSRLASEVRIPGITLIVNDSKSDADWELDNYMEHHRMKCWVAVQAKLRRWGSSSGAESPSPNDLRSPYARATHPETLRKIIEILVAQSHDEVITHNRLRREFIGHNEFIPPTAELYLHVIAKLKPKSIHFSQVAYCSGIAAVLEGGTSPESVRYNLSNLCADAAESIRSFIQNSGDDTATRLVEEDNTTSDLIFIDVVPYATHDLRAYLGEESTPRHVSYPDHIRRWVIEPLKRSIQARDEGRSGLLRIAMLFSLRELPMMPTIEPALLSILADDELSSRIQIVGALISQKRDYAFYLMIVMPPQPQSSSSREHWNRHLTRLYPELFSSPRDELSSAGGVLLVKKKVSSSITSGTQQGSGTAPWESECLSAAKLECIASLLPIALQGPRLVQGKHAFPTRTRQRVLVKETDSAEGSVTYEFGDTWTEPPLIIVEEPADPLLSKMVQGIKASSADKT